LSINTNQKGIYPVVNFGDIILLTNSGIKGIIKEIGLAQKGFIKDYITGLIEGFRNLKECDRVDFTEIKKSNILALEGEIIFGTFEYVYRFIKRHSG